MRTTLLLIAFAAAGPLFGQQAILTDLPEVRGPFTLTAMYDSTVEHNAFAYGGKPIPPVIRVNPGGVIKVHYVNGLPAKSTEECAAGPCMNMTNLHFHGLHVSPNRPQDDVLSIMAMPGESLDYRVVIPPYAPPGLYWYHTHPHGESARQDLDGMSGAIVVEGIDRYYPELRHMRERVIVLRDRNIEHSDRTSKEQILRQVEIPAVGCGTATDQTVARVFTANAQVRPWIPIDPGERQFWRILNASPDRYADLQLSGQQFQVVALDGMPLTYHNPNRKTKSADHVLLPPAGRVEAIVVGPSSGQTAVLSTRCVDTGPDGDANPSMVIADVGPAKTPSPMHSVPISAGAAEHRLVAHPEIQRLESSQPDFVVTFTEDKHGFYINGQKFSMADGPMLRVKAGSMQHWRVVNATNELHPFHIHQIHFLAYQENGSKSDSPEWLDTVNVPYHNGTVDLIMDFTDPIIKGMSLFHCHLLSHEDKGMMAKILFE
jgi:FtsP/CotA-like multicopper oxidase with cupredoxin domain